MIGFPVDVFEGGRREEEIYRINTILCRLYECVCVFFFFFATRGPPFRVKNQSLVFTNKIYLHWVTHSDSIPVLFPPFLPRLSISRKKGT